MRPSYPRPAGPPIRYHPRPDREERMAGTYKMIEIVGTSPTSFADAVRAAVETASKTVRHMDWFEVIEQRGAIKDGHVKEFQVTIKVGFKVEG
jgi:flavin-binding protein dodecin